MSALLWICGRHYAVLAGTTHSAWALIGIFDSRSLAVAACEGERDFVAPVKLNENMVAVTGYMEMEYPLNPREGGDA